MYVKLLALASLVGALLGGKLPPPSQAAPPAAAPLRVMSFNIRYNNPNDGQDAWPHRKDRVAGLIRFHQADIVGVQEALKGMLDDLQERLPGYKWVGAGRADGKEEGEFSAIFYRPRRLELLEHDTFWLSETPEQVASVGWDASMERIATWARFRDRLTGEVFYHVNTHFDHRGEVARRESARLVVNRVREMAGGAPIIVTGDFNALEGSPPYEVMTGEEAFRDAFYASEQPSYGPNSTWNGFDQIEPGRRIDFIFVSEDVQVLQHGILTDSWDGRFPSDHLPVLAEVAIQ